jgi:hypothetical protein
VSIGCKQHCAKSRRSKLQINISVASAFSVLSERHLLPEGRASARPGRAEAHPSELDSKSLPDCQCNDFARSAADRQVNRPAADAAIFDQILFGLRSIHFKAEHFSTMRTRDIRGDG